MTHPDQTPYQEADACLALMRAQVDAGLQHLNRACSSEGRLSAEQLDAHQEVSYELAFCIAELEASIVMLRYAQQVSTQDEMCEPMALSFCAENIRAVWQRLLAHATELALSNRHLLDLMGSEPLAGFLARFGDISQIAAIGAALLARTCGR